MAKYKGWDRSEKKLARKRDRARTERMKKVEQKMKERDSSLYPLFHFVRLFYKPLLVGITVLLVLLDRYLNDRKAKS